MVIAGVDSAENGGNIANLMFTLCLLFCGVLAQPSDFPRFWIFMYRLSPFTYLVSGMLSVGLANSSVQCAARELISFQPRSGSTCGEYMKAYTSFAGGFLVDDNATSDCQFCSISDTNVFLKTKKEKSNKKAVAVKEQVSDEPSRVGSSLGHNEHEKETNVNAETMRYASITGDTTPPRETTVHEKV
jgi:ATP-binding cassette subfamily G (WHITE) protein 2 (PDR)